MALGEGERHLLSGVDDRHRGFSRQLEVNGLEGRYHATLQYEKLCLTSEGCATKEDALLWVVETLHTKGYRQLRSRLSFRGGTYFGSLDAWIDYPDPVGGTSQRSFLQRMGVLWGRLFHS